MEKKREEGEGENIKRNRQKVVIIRGAKKSI
jgi:hypothetical protein